MQTLLILSYSSMAMQGCLQFLSNAVLENLYDLGAIGMAFGTFEVSVPIDAHQSILISVNKVMQCLCIFLIKLCIVTYFIN